MGIKENANGFTKLSTLTGTSAWCRSDAELCAGMQAAVMQASLGSFVG